MMLIRVDDDLVRFRMVVESQDDDGLAYCRLSNDCVIMVEVSDRRRLDLGKKVNIGVPVRDVRLTLV